MNKRKRRARLLAVVAIAAATLVVLQALTQVERARRLCGECGIVENYEALRRHNCGSLPVQLGSDLVDAADDGATAYNDSAFFDRSQTGADRKLDAKATSQYKSDRTEESYALP